jgi:hypothetical protein
VNKLTSLFVLMLFASANISYAQTGVAPSGPGGPTLPYTLPPPPTPYQPLTAPAEGIPQAKVWQPNVSQLDARAPQGSQWTVVASSTQGSLYLRSGSIHRARGRSGEVVIAGMVQFIPSPSYDAPVSYTQYVVPIKACKVGIGKIYAFDLDGNFQNAHDYVQGGSSGASEIGDVLCRSAST